MVKLAWLLMAKIECWSKNFSKFSLELVHKSGDFENRPVNKRILEMQIALILLD
jgi:hypothetical protein